MRDRSVEPSMWRASGLVCSAALCVMACTSFETAVTEFDSVAGLEDSENWPEDVEYRHDPLRYPWLLRQLDGMGFGTIFKFILQAQRTVHDVENPSGFARERLEIMVYRAQGDLLETALTARRLLWVADLDAAQPMNQAVAVLGLGRLLESLDLDPFAMRLPDPSVTTEEKFEEWLTVLDEGWPLKRETPELPLEQRSDYLGALEAITTLPYPRPAGQRGLIGALTRLWEMESDPALTEPARKALMGSLFHGLSMGLRRALYSPAPVVRESAIRSLHRLGGPDAVPIILSWVAKPSSAASRGVNRYDDDKFVRLALVRICGQLGTEQAVATHAGGPAPAEFLYQTFFDDPDVGLQTVALEALAHCLRRDVSFEREWAETWWSDEYLPNLGASARR